MHPPKLGIWKYRLVWHSITCWGTQLCIDLALRRTKRTQSCFPWNRGENSPLIFTTQSSLSFLLSHRPNPCTVWFPTWFLNIISVYTFSKQVFGGAFRGRFWSTFLQYRAVWATEARAPRSFLSIIIVILTLMLTLYFSVVSLKTQIWLSIHLKKKWFWGFFTMIIIQGKNDQFFSKISHCWWPTNSTEITYYITFFCLYRSHSPPDFIVCGVPLLY